MTRSPWALGGVGPDRPFGLSIVPLIVPVNAAEPPVTTEKLWKKRNAYRPGFGMFACGGGAFFSLMLVWNVAVRKNWETWSEQVRWILERAIRVSRRGVKVFFCARLFLKMKS